MTDLAKLLAPVSPPTPNTVPALLTAIADTFEQHPEKFTQGAFARDAAGGRVPSCSPDAVCFCALGLIHRLTNQQGNEEAINALQAASFELYGEELLMALNDKFGREAVIAVARRAAACYR